MKNTVHKKLPRRHGKGVGAEADAVAGIRLAVRITSVLLSLLRRVDHSQAEGYHQNVIPCVCLREMAFRSAVSFFL